MRDSLNSIRSVLTGVLFQIMGVVHFASTIYYPQSDLDFALNAIYSVSIFAFGVVILVKKHMRSNVPYIITLTVTLMVLALLISITFYRLIMLKYSS